MEKYEHSHNVCVVIYVHVNVIVALVLLSFPHLFHWINFSCGQYEKQI